MRKRMRASATNEEHYIIRKVMVPVKFRKEIQNMGRDVIANHMGRRKTGDRITSFYYWPRIMGDIGIRAVKYAR